VLKSGRVLRTKEKKMNKTIISYPCQVDPALKADCLAKSAHVDIFAHRPHYCGPAFEQVVEVVEVEFVPVTRKTEKQLNALKLKARELKAQGVKTEEAYAELNKARGQNRMVPQFIAGRETTGDRKLIIYRGRNLQGKNLQQFKITDFKLADAWKSFNLPALPAKV
tara:strand:+ start:2389 stop:2886 length:498 start_codon:yes stop_codon:yes gene_type:complete